MSPRSQSRAGYLLLETMVAVVVVAVALSATLTTLRSALTASDRAVHLSRATLLAESKLAELRAGGVGIIGETAGRFDSDKAGPDYRWRTVVRPVAPERFYAVTVDVAWRERGRTRRVSLRSLIKDARP